MDLGDLVSVLQACIGTGATPETAPPQYRPPILEVSADDAAQARVRQVLAAVERLLSAHANVEIYDLERGTASEVRGLLGRDATAALLAKPGARLAHAAPARFGVATTLSGLTQRAYVRDYDVEVAQDAIAGDPVVDVLLTGFRALVRVEPTPDARFAITVRASRQSEPSPPREKEVTFTAKGVIQLPVVDWTVASASAIVDDGGSIIFGTDDVHGGRWLVRVQSDAASATPIIPGGLVIPAGVALLPPFAESFPAFGNVTASGAPVPPADTHSPPSARISADELTQAIRQGEATESSPTTAPAVTIAGLNLFLTGDAVRTQEAAARISEMLACVMPAVTVELRAGFLEAADVARLADVPGEVAERLSLRLSTTVRANDRSTLVSSRSQAYVKDVDIEVASNAVVADPIVGSLLTGTGLEFRVAPLDADRWVVRWRFAATEGDGRFDVVSTPDQNVRSIELPRIATFRSQGTALLRQGAWAVLHAAPSPDTNRTCVALLRLSR